MFTVRVDRQIEAAHHNGPLDSKCYVNHGHSWRITAVVPVRDEHVDVSPFGWSVDFHQIKDIIDAYDHQDLNELLAKPSAEELARTIYHAIQAETGFRPTFVQVTEGSGNSVRYTL